MNVVISKFETLYFHVMQLLFGYIVSDILFNEFQYFQPAKWQYTNTLQRTGGKTSSFRS
jgi:hypothetical protein